MPQAKMVVYSSPSSPDREDEYNKWYNEIHLAEVCAMPGILSAVRFSMSEAQMVPGVTVAGHRYMAIYEVDAPDFTALLADMLARSQDGRFTMSDAIDMTANPPITLMFEPLAG
ncbi:conserved hypothetical protein [Frankia canadensis]|uniref:Ethyl tert-butyl ether degradation protein EthD n=1 Tax=Frankia canadensis TaxID=1836972 RepID=A0A2I2KJH8_9ACTN|nr:DUF4286 family protein [Frankia canadensis]SNQ45804.1 conserved hypothetical protein [Frankia canadensis]SOU53094.1 conserved hypothetical protein [Frankia canadensis]